MSEVNVIEQKGNHNSDIKIAIVLSRFNSFVVDRLYDGAMKCFAANNIDSSNVTVVKVPGAFEIPVAAAALLETGEYDAVVTLGAIIRGETPHFDFIANECANGIAQLAIKHVTPVIFGVLTVDNVDQAMDRTGEEESNKGYEAVAAALEMIGVVRKIKS